MKIFPYSVFHRITFSRYAVKTVRHMRSPTQESEEEFFPLFQKMKNEITLKGDTLSHLDFNLAPKDVLLNCSDGQVGLFFVVH